MTGKARMSRGPEAMDVSTVKGRWWDKRETEGRSVGRRKQVNVPLNTRRVALCYMPVPQTSLGHTSTSSLLNGLH